MSALPYIASASLPLNHHRHRRNHHQKPPPHLPPQSVSTIAQSISHLPPISESASRYLAPEAEYRIRQVVQDALKFMKHSKRTRLTPTDINSALNLRNSDPVFGFGPQSYNYSYSRTFNNRFPNLSTSQSNSQPLNNRHQQSNNKNVQPQQLDSTISTDVQNNDSIPGTGGISSIYRLNTTKVTVPDPPSFAPVSGIPNLFFACDKDHNLADMLTEPLPPVPLEATVMAHWLAIDSKQPAIPQNPTRGDEIDNETENAGNDNDTSLMVMSSSASHHPSSSSMLTKRPRRDEVNGSTGGHVKRLKRQRSNSVNGTMIVNNGISSSSNRKTSGVSDATLSTEVIPRIRHNLSRELQFYFDYIRQAIFKNDAELIENSLHSISSEHGIVQLLPYLSSFIATTTRSHMNDLPLLFSLMRLMMAIVENKAFKLETYLHQMLPACVSCIVGKRLCSHPSQNHWALRDYSAGLFRRICDQFEKEYVDLKRRFVVTLASALDNLNRPLTTHYGAIVGFTALGPRTISKCLIPRLPDYASKVRLVLDSRDQSAVRRFEAAKVYTALAYAVSIYQCTIGVEEEDDDIDENISKPKDIQLKKNLTTTVGSKIIKPPEFESIQPQDIQRFVPDATRLIPILQKEYGTKVLPLGKNAFDLQVANDILKLAATPTTTSIPTKK